MKYHVSLCIIRIHICYSSGYTMTKTAALRIRIAPELHQDFLEICKHQDLSASHVLRQFMRSYVEEHRNEQQGELFSINKKRQQHDN